MKSGWLFLLLSIFAYGLWGFFAKISQRNGADALLLTLLTAMGAGIIAVIFCLPQIDWHTARTNQWGLIMGILAGIAVGIGNIVLYRAFQTIPVSIAIPVSSLYVAITILLAFVFLKEHLSLTQGAGVMLAIVAVMLMSK